MPSTRSVRWAVCGCADAKQSSGFEDPSDRPARARHDPWWATGFAHLNSRGERRPQSLLQSGARQRADNPVDFFPVPNHHEQRDRLCAKPGGQSWVRVDVDLHDLQMPRVTFGEVFEHGRDHPTGPAPRRPEIHHDRHGRGRLCRERAGVRVHDPRQRGLAPRTSRHSLRDRADAIARVTGRAANDGHDHQSRTRRSRGRRVPPDRPLESASGPIPAATRRTCVNRSTEICGQLVDTSVESLLSAWRETGL